MKQIDAPHFLEELLRRADKPVALVLHQSADPDALGSAAALAILLKAKTGNECHIFAEGLNRSAKNIAEAFDISLTPAEDLVKFSTIIFVDLNNIEQSGILADHFTTKGSVVFCIDHHTLHEELPKFVHFLLHDNQIRATAELVLKLWIASGETMSPDVATLLACGLVYDSRHFFIARNSTFENFATLLQHGADYQFVINLLSTPLDKSERLARLKAAKRVVVYDEFDLLIAATFIGSYEASVCRGLISLGADIAIACASKKDEVRLSARCNNEVISKWGIDLAKHVMEPLGEQIGGAGGGHPSAAGANGTASSDHALGLALQLLRKELKARRANVEQRD